jgi:hypothetical protein
MYDKNTRLRLITNVYWKAKIPKLRLYKDGMDTQQRLTYFWVVFMHIL